MNGIAQNSEIGLFERIKASLKAFIGGGILFAFSFIVLWKNEGCAVSQQAALDELKTKVVKADAENPTVGMNGKPVMLQAPLYSKNFVHDDQFIGKQPFLKMVRVVEMYQWVEKVDRNSKKSRDKYIYSKEWSEDYKQSSLFKVPEGHTNPKPDLQSETFLAKDITFGKFKGENLLIEVPAEEPIFLTEEKLSPQIQSLKSKLKKNSLNVADNHIYLTTVSFLRPEIGDLRIKYFGVKSDYYTAIGLQTNTSQIEAYKAEEGFPILIVEKGIKTIKSMIKAEQQRNDRMTWIFRGLGAFLMWVGLMALLRPFLYLVEAVPVIGNFVSVGVFAVAAVVSLCLSVITIIIAKLFYNPIFLIPILLAMGGFLYWQSKKQSNSKMQSHPYRSAHPVLARAAAPTPAPIIRKIPMPSSSGKRPA